MPWRIQPSEKYLIALKAYAKKYPEELDAVMRNFKDYTVWLDELDNPMLVRAGFIHDEPGGVIAIDQKGKSKTKLRQTRLYLYPDPGTKCIHLITIGNKNEQADDLTLCRKFLKTLSV